MKKLLLIPTLFTLASTPLISLTACKDKVKVSQINISGEQSVRMFESIQLTATVLPENADNKNIVWSIDDTTKATIDQEGNVTPISKGNVVVTATAQDGSNVSSTFNLSIVNPAAVDFQTDPWETVCFLANEGIDTLCEAYDCAANDFVGKDRKVVLNGIDHVVRVIGVNQDYIDEEHQCPVALTFQFNNVVCGSDGGTMLTKWWRQGEISSNNKEYWNSDLDKVLTSTEPVDWSNHSDEHQSVYSMIEEAEPYLAANIKEVYRGVNVMPTGGEWQTSARKTKIFHPTISNLYSATGIKAEGSVIPEEYADLYIQEGQVGDINKQYTYYANDIKNDPVDISIVRYTSLCKAPTTGSGQMNYWLASPKITSNGWLVQGYQTDKRWFLTTPAMLHDQSSCVVPCFCI